LDVLTDFEPDWIVLHLLGVLQLLPYSDILWRAAGLRLLARGKANGWSPNWAFVLCSHPLAAAHFKAACCDMWRDNATPFFKKWYEHRRRRQQRRVEGMKKKGGAPLHRSSHGSSGRAD
jgi:hypothetical protein